MDEFPLEWWVYLPLAALFGVVFPSPFIRWVLDPLRELRDEAIRAREPEKELPLYIRAYPTVLGWVERAFVMGVLIGLANAAQYIVAGWLVLKAAVEWPEWSKGDTGRATYSLFLIGTGMSLVFALAGYAMFSGGKGHNLILMFSPTVAVYFGACLLWVYLQGQKTKQKSNTPAE